MDFYDFMETCKEEGLDADEAIDEWYEHVAQRRRQVIEDYENDPCTWEGWH